MSLAKDDNANNSDEKSSVAQERAAPVAHLLQDFGSCCEFHMNGGVKFKISHEALSDCLQEVCKDDNASLPVTNCMQNVMNERTLLEDKENLINSCENGSFSSESCGEFLPHTLQGSSLLTPFDVGNFSFDLCISADSDAEMFSDILLQQVCETDSAFDVWKKGSTDHHPENVPDDVMVCKNTSAIKVAENVVGTQGERKNDSKMCLLPAEKTNLDEVKASIKENTGKKRGRKKMYTARSYVEEMYLKRARNNEACGKYRSMKKKKLEILFEEEKSLNEANRKLKAACKQMENEKNILTKLLLLLIKQNSPAVLTQLKESFDAQNETNQ